MLRKNLAANHVTIYLATAWLFFLCGYASLKYSVGRESLAALLPLIGEVGLDFVAVVLSFNLWFNAAAENKKIYLAFLVSFVAATFADGIYNLVLNLYQFQYENSIVASLFEVPFAIFLFFQAMAWKSISAINSTPVSDRRKSLYIPFVLSAILLFTMFVFILSWRIERFSVIGLFQCIDTLLESVGFALASMCLARARTAFIRYAATGYLLVVTSDIIIRYYVVSGAIPYLSLMESTWVLGLVLMCAGLIFAKSNSCKEQIRLFPISSLQSQVAAWLLILWLMSIVIFTLTYYVFLREQSIQFHDFVRHILASIIPLSVLVIAASSYIAGKISMPLNRLEKIIRDFTDNDEIRLAELDKDKVNFIVEFSTLEKFVFDSFKLYKKKHQMEMEFANVATQVAHDIRSPLESLTNLSKDVIKLNEDQREIIALSISRINEITESLLMRHRGLQKNDISPSDKPSSNPELIYPILGNVIAEKKVEFKNNNDVNIEFVSDKAAENLFCSINRANFKRVISNLINNSVEAIESGGKITISLSKDTQNVLVEIKDTGCGIPDEVLNNIGSNSPSKKDTGNGLGLQHAIKCISEWKGKYSISTKENVGTSFVIVLPIQNAPCWMQANIYLRESDPVIIMLGGHDDVFRFISEKINKSFGFILNNFFHLRSEDDIFEFIDDKYRLLTSQKDVYFFIEYDLPDASVNGLEFIKMHSIQKNAILMINKYPDSDVLDEIVRLNVKAIFKSFLAKTPVNIVYKHPDYVLLDDKIIITKMWILEAIKHGRKIVTFNNKNDLFSNIDHFDKSVEIYVDADLGDDNGELVTKYLHDYGFVNLHITTGHESAKYTCLPWIKSVIGKSPDFMRVRTVK